MVYIISFIKYGILTYIYWTKSTKSIFIKSFAECNMKFMELYIKIFLTQRLFSQETNIFCHVCQTPNAPACITIHSSRRLVYSPRLPSLCVPYMYYTASLQ